MSNLSEVSDVVSDASLRSDEEPNTPATATLSVKREREVDVEWNKPDWYDEAKHGKLAPNVKKAGGFPVTASKFPSLGENVAIVDGMRDFCTGKVEIRAANGKPAATAAVLNKNIYYSPFVDGFCHNHALYGTTYDELSFKSGNQVYPDEYSMKVRLDNVSCEDLELFQGKTEYYKNENGEFEFIKPEDRCVQDSAVFKATIESFRYDHVSKVCEKELEKIGFFDEVPDEASLGDKRENKWVNRLVRDVLGKIDLKKKWEPHATDYRNIGYKTGFSFPYEPVKNEDGSVKEFRNYSSKDGVVTFRLEMPIQNDGAEGFVFKSSMGKRQNLKTEKGKSKFTEIKKVHADGSTTFPDIAEFMSDFSPKSGAKHVMILMKYQFTLHDKKGAPAIKPKVLKLVYHKPCVKANDEEEGSFV